MMNLLAKLKNLFASVAIVALLAAPFMPLVAQAQVGDASGVPGGQQAIDAQTQAAVQAASSGNVTPTTQPANPSINPTQQQNIDDIGCWQAGGSVGNSIATCLANVVYTFSVGIGTGFAYVSAYFFDWAVSLSLNSLAYSQQFVSQGWTTARDIANMAFLFIILYVAFIIMFQADTNGTLQTLLRVIVIALLINFSFFGVRLIIDAGNIVAIQFYNAINVQSIATTASGSGVSATVLSTLNTVGSAVGSSVGGGNTKDLTQGIMGMLNLQGLFSVPSFQAFKNSNPSPLVTFITLSFLYIAAGIMFWILSVTFAVAGVKFIVRVVALWFLIIASPLALVAYAFSGGGGTFKKWLDTLISETFYPVVFLFVFLMLTIFANQMGQTNGLINGIFNGLQGANGQNGIAQIGLAAANVGIRLGLVVAVLWAGLKFANDFKTMGSKAAGSFGGWVGGTFGKTWAGAFGVAGRNTFGRLGNAVGQSQTVKQGAAQSGFTGTLWRGVSRTTNRLGSATYDVRNAPGADAVGGALKEAGLMRGTGKVPTQGFAEQRKAAEDAKEKERKERAAVLRDQANKEALERIARNAAAGTSANSKDVERVKNFNKREFDKLKASEIESIAHVITENQLKSAVESDKHTDEEKEKIRTKWHETNNAAPLIKAQKALTDELRTFNASLRSGISLNTLSASAATGSLINNGAIINSASVQAVLQDIKNSMATVRNNIRNAPLGTNTQNMQYDLDQLTNIRRTVEQKFDEERKKIPAGTKRHPNAGEFVAG